MGSLYTDEIRLYVSSRPWPSGLTYEIVEYEDCLRIRLFRDNINALSGEAKLQLAATLNEMLNKIQGSGVPIYTEVARGDGRGDRHE